MLQVLLRRHHAVAVDVRCGEEAADLLTPSNELSNIMRREELLIDMPWKQGLLSIMELCFDLRARAGLQSAAAAARVRPPPPFAVLPPAIRRTGVWRWGMAGGWTRRHSGV